MATQEYKFEGWMGLDADSAKGKLVWQEFEPKPFEETDVDIEITHCGICATDLHSLRSGHGPTPYRKPDKDLRAFVPQLTSCAAVCVGHEIVGKAVRVGKNAKRGIKLGDRVGVGAMNSACFKADCEECSSGLEHHCPHMVVTYASTYPDGSRSQGGYGNYHRAHSGLVFKIPDRLLSEQAAPFLCAGITMYSPLKNNGCGPEKRVGIVGVGGLGHYGIILAKALSAKRIIGISRKNDKRPDVLKMGADDYIATDEDQDWPQRHAKSLDLIVCTVNSPKMPLENYLKLLRVNGTFIQVGAPEDKLPSFSAHALIGSGLKIGGSMIGSPAEIEEMLQLAVDKRVQAWIQTRPMSDANQALVDMDQGKARYRYTLINKRNLER